MVLFLGGFLMKVPASSMDIGVLYSGVDNVAHRNFTPFLQPSQPLDASAVVDINFGFD
jgi:hypothetical protein